MTPATLTTVNSLIFGNVQELKFLMGFLIYRLEISGDFVNLIRVLMLSGQWWKANKTFSDESALFVYIESWLKLVKDVIKFSVQDLTSQGSQYAWLYQRFPTCILALVLCHMSVQKGKGDVLNSICLVKKVGGGKKSRRAWQRLGSQHIYGLCSPPSTLPS